MFGTLVSTDFDQGTLEFVENPDPVSAVSRNLRDEIHISCTFCRSRKIRCSGDRKRCQRCVAMGLECVYPQSRVRNKRRESTKSRRGTLQRDENLPTRIACDETEPSARNGQVESGEEFALEDLQDITFNDSCIDDFLFAPWIMDTPMQHGLDSGSSTSSISTAASAIDLSTSESSFSVQSRGATVAPPIQLPELSIADTPSTSLRNPLPTDSAADLESWDEPHTTHGDFAWAISVGARGTSVSTPEPLSIEPWSKPRSESDSCRCLLSSISFLERLVSRSASQENRIDILLADFRNSIETLKIFLACERCATQVEQNMLLAMAARQISIICGKTANCYKAIYISGLGDTNSSKRKPEANPSAGPVDVSVSTYRVNQRERLHLLRSLVTLHIVELQQHINTIKSRYPHRSDQGQAEALIEAKSHIRLARIAINSHS